MNHNTPLPVVTLRERPELQDVFYAHKTRIWPPFMMEDVVANKLWHMLAEAFADFTFYLLEGDRPIAVGHAIPITWDGTVADLPVGWNNGFQRGVDNFRSGVAPNTLMAIEASIAPEYAGRGISYQIIAGMRRRAQQFGLQAVIAPVRPSHKSRYPLTPMVRYVHWTREDGLPFDPWLRVHVRLGGEIVKVCHPAMRIEGSVADWEGWTGMRFPDSGEYIVPGALTPISIEREADWGLYLEPNVWVHHPLTTRRLTHAHQPAAIGH